MQRFVDWFVAQQRSVTLEQKMISDLLLIVFVSPRYMRQCTVGGSVLLHV
jgi:hypothetical protein